MGGGLGAFFFFFFLIRLKIFRRLSFITINHWKSKIRRRSLQFFCDVVVFYLKLTVFGVSLFFINRHTIRQRF